MMEGRSTCQLNLEASWTAWNLSRDSCTRDSPISRIPQRAAARMSSAETALETAMSLISSFFRPDLWAALSIRSRTFARFWSIIPPNLLTKGVI